VTQDTSPGSGAASAVAAPQIPVVQFISAWAGITQLVECQLPKLKVAGSIPVARSTFCNPLPGVSAMGLFARDDKPTAGGQGIAPSRTAQSPQPSQPQPQHAAQGPGREVTIVAESARFDGTLGGSGDIHICGRFQGKIDSSGNLMIAASGRVKASLHARTVIVSGSVEGDVSAEERIELKPSAKLTGNITAPRILIEEGAAFEGQVHMQSPSAPKAGTVSSEPAPAEEKEQPEISSARRPKNGK
jgi:cytoskeletal protein CcmA (bactofilin family)